MDIREQIEELRHIRHEAIRDMRQMQELEERARERQSFFAAMEQEFKAAQLPGRYSEECIGLLDSGARNCYRSVVAIEKLIAELERLLPTEPMRG